MSAYPPQQFMQPQPDHKKRLIWHLLFMLLIEPIVLGGSAALMVALVITFPIAIVIALVWLGLFIWHIVAIILAIIGLNQQPPTYQ